MLRLVALNLLQSIKNEASIKDFPFTSTSSSFLVGASFTIKTFERWLERVNTKRQKSIKKLFRPEKLFSLQVDGWDLFSNKASKDTSTSA